MAGIIPDLSDQITRLIHSLEKVKDLKGQDVGLQAEISNFMGTLKTDLSCLNTSLPHTISAEAIGSDTSVARAEIQNYLQPLASQSNGHNEKLEKLTEFLEKGSKATSTGNSIATDQSRNTEELVAHVLATVEQLQSNRRPASSGSSRSNYDDSSGSGSDARAAIAEIQNLLQPLALQIKRQHQTLEKLTDFVKRGSEATASNSRATDQATNREKLFPDVLPIVGQLQKNVRLASSSSSRSYHDDSSGSNKFMEDLMHDPLTRELMVDPVKGSDGHTYDRWTILNQAIPNSPFTREPLSIVCDDVNVRSCIFERFPAQEEQFLKLREEYRRTTLDLVREGQYGEALERLDHVLKWAPKDSECQELQRALPNRLQKLQSLAESTIFLGSNAATAGFTSRRDLEGAATSDHLPAENSVFSRIWKKLKFGVVIIPIMIVLLIVFPIVALLSCLIGDCLDEGISADCKNKYQSIEEWINGLIDDIES